MKIRKRYEKFEHPGIDFTVLDEKTGEFVPELSRTKQAEKDSCDINHILARYEKTGQLPDLIREDARYGDFTDVPSFQDAFEIVERAQTQFEALSAETRKLFDNDPANMLAFVQDPANKEKLVEYGLAVPPASASASAATTDTGGKTSDSPTKA